jgi:hypothetical protein
MVEALNGAAHAKTAFWPPKASIMLYGLTQENKNPLSQEETLTGRQAMQFMEDG